SFGIEEHRATFKSFNHAFSSGEVSIRIRENKCTDGSRGYFVDKNIHQLVVPKNKFGTNIEVVIATILAVVWRGDIVENKVVPFVKIDEGIVLGLIVTTKSRGECSNAHSES